MIGVMLKCLAILLLPMMAGCISTAVDFTIDCRGGQPDWSRYDVLYVECTCNDPDMGYSSVAGLLQRALAANDPDKLVVTAEMGDDGTQNCPDQLLRRSELRKRLDGLKIDSTVRQLADLPSKQYYESAVKDYMKWIEEEKAAEELHARARGTRSLTEDSKLEVASGVLRAPLVLSAEQKRVKFEAVVRSYVAHRLFPNLRKIYVKREDVFSSSRRLRLLTHNLGFTFRSGERVAQRMEFRELKNGKPFAVVEVRYPMKLFSDEFETYSDDGLILAVYPFVLKELEKSQGNTSISARLVYHDESGFSVVNVRRKKK